MSKKVIFVNATSATRGGSLTVLNQFINNVKQIREKDKFYYIFIPIDNEFVMTDYYNLIPVKAKSYMDRIKWDVYGMKKWSRDKQIYPDLIISLQNTGVIFNNVKQIIYLHQPLPYAKESVWSILKKDERKMWFYKYIYKIWIDISIKDEHKIIVQTKWMKDALIADGYDDKNIIISKPNINAIDINSISTIKKDKSKIYFFYPAADYKYKNHLIIIEALNKIKEKNIELLNKIKVIFTIDETSIYYKMAKEYKLDHIIEFQGNKYYDEILELYKSADVILFPSYIETFGLPLIEASIFGKKILCSDCSYSREVLENYNNVEFIPYNNLLNWERKIVESLNVYKNEITEVKYFNGWSSVNKLVDLELKCK